MARAGAPARDPRDTAVCAPRPAAGRATVPPEIDHTAAPTPLRRSVSLRAPSTFPASAVRPGRHRRPAPSAPPRVARVIV